MSLVDTVARYLITSLGTWCDCCNHSHAMECVSTINCNFVMVNVISYVLNNLVWCKICKVSTLTN